MLGSMISRIKQEEDRIVHGSRLSVGNGRDAIDDVIANSGIDIDKVEAMVDVPSFGGRSVYGSVGGNKSYHSSSICSGRIHGGRRTDPRGQRPQNRAAGGARVRSHNQQSSRRGTFDPRRAYSSHRVRTPAYQNVVDATPKTPLYLDSRQPTSLVHRPEASTSALYSPSYRSGSSFSPMSPVYAPKSPAYNPAAGAQRGATLPPMSPLYTSNPVVGVRMFSPMSPAYTPKSPAYNPVAGVSNKLQVFSPCYAGTAYTATNPSVVSGKMSPCYESSAPSQSHRSKRKATREASSAGAKRSKDGPLPSVKKVTFKIDQTCQKKDGGTSNQWSQMEEKVSVKKLREPNQMRSLDVVSSSSPSKCNSAQDGRVEYDPCQPQFSPSYDPDPYFNLREYNPVFPSCFD